MAIFQSLYSGSSGNCSLISNGKDFVLVDMGKSARQTTKCIYETGHELNRLQGIFITHEHSDHVSGLNIFLKYNNVPLFASARTIDALIQYKLVPPGTTLVEIDGRAVELGDIAVKGFRTSHDSADCNGFRININNSTMAIATDLGVVTADVRENIKGTNLVALEANYDKLMLQTGPYPSYLKKRISSPYGHLDNKDTAAELATLLQAGCERFALCHLSKENNLPSLARDEVEKAFAAQGAQQGSYILGVAKREAVSDAIEF